MHRSQKHLAWIRTLPSALSGRVVDIQACHVRIGTGGGMGLKPSDIYVVPLTHGEHMEQHSRGERTFWSEHGYPDPAGEALSYALQSPCEATREAARAVVEAKQIA